MKTLRPYQEKAVNEAWAMLKKSSAPVLFEMSVGGGKSICISSVLKTMVDQGKNALCLVSSAELVRNNSEEFKEFGGDPSIFCASLNDKSHDKNIVFATPQSVINAVKSNHPLAQRKFNLIIVDECHQINFHNHRSIFMRILRHYKAHYKDMRLLGFTGTPFRGEESIVGEEAVFKSHVANISTSYLIEHNYLVPPVFVTTETEGFDFSKCRPQNTGEFKGSDLQKVVDNKRLTWDILQEVDVFMQKRNVCIVFCSTKSHCYEAFSALPKGSARIILGDTKSDERHKILTLARNKEIKYLVSVNCLLVGVNVPAIDCIAWLRPTSSLLLYIQGIGRGLRLNDGKQDCWVLDYAGNTSRFQDFDDPIINEAVQPDEEIVKDYVIICPACSQLNTETARRCVGVTNDKRCDYYFEFRECPNTSCNAQNDIAARQCRLCEAEIIDPNAKLNINLTKTVVKIVTVKEMLMGVSGGAYGFRVNIEYKCFDEHGKKFSVYEGYTPMSEKGKNIFYGKFVRVHCETSSYYYPHLRNIEKVKEMLDHITAPKLLHLNMKDDGVKIKKKLF